MMSSSGSGSPFRPGSDPVAHGGRAWAAGLILAVLLALAVLPAAGAAQGAAPSPFLFINQERILTGSKAGQVLLADEEKRRDALRTEARSLDSSFEAEERSLTDQRPKLAPEEFRKLSDAFDARVVKARQDQDARASALADEFDQRRRQFYAQVAPILVSLMDRYGAKAIFDENSVLVADQTLNITEAVIAEIDARAAAAPPAAAEPGTPTPGSNAPSAGDQPAPAPPAAGTDGGN